MYEIPTRQRLTYLHNLLQSYGTLSLPLGTGLNFSLLQVYQPLRLRQSAEDDKKLAGSDEKDPQRDAADGEEEAEGIWKKDAAQEKKALASLAENGIEALDKSPHGRIVILGGPGTGKTTVLKHLLYHHIQRALLESTAPLPIFLSLPDLARAGQDLHAYLSQIARDMGLDADNDQLLSQAIQHGQAFVCLDSLDEVLPRLRAGIIRQINELAHNSGNIWIVGSRFTDYKGGQFQQGQFQEWELQPLDHERRLRLAAQLLPELQHQLTLSGYSISNAESNADPYVYVQALSEHQQAATWGTNPLLFSLGAVVYLRRGNLAGSRAMLYREVIDALLETRGGDAQLRSILAHVALELYQIKGRTFTQDDLRDTLMNLNIAQKASWHVAEMHYRILNSGLLDIVSRETYSFRHQTFQEYLVASALASRFMSEDETAREAAQDLAWSKHTYSRWNEIERLLVGILVQEYGEIGLLQVRTWLSRLLRQRDSIEGDPGNLSLELAIKALGEVAQLEEWQGAGTLALEETVAVVWTEEVKNSSHLDTLGGNNSDRYMLMAADIGRLHPAAQKKAIEPLVTAFVEGQKPYSGLLGAIHSHYIVQYLLEALKRYPNQQWSIKCIFEFLGELAPIDILLDDLGTQDHAAISNAGQALEKLAPYVPGEKLVPILLLHGFGRPKAAENVLLKIAKTKELPIAALLDVLHGKQPEGAFHAALVLASVQHPAAIDFLLTLLNDLQAHKRRAALEALGQYKTLVPIDSIIGMLDDKDAHVRLYAINVLADFGSAVPLERLVQAANDSNDYVRQKAIELAGQLGDRIPVEILIRATNDSRSWIADSAIVTLGTLGLRAPLALLLGFLGKPHLLNAALNALSQKEMAGLVPAQPLLDLYEQNWEKRGTILKTLDSIGYPVVITLLIDALCSGDEDLVRIEVGTLLGQKAGLTAEHIMVLEERAYPVYNRAIAILGSRYEPHTIGVLLQALADERWSVSDAAASELCKRADEPVLADLLVLLKHRRAWVRKNVLRVLVECTYAVPVEPLVQALHDRDGQVRALAAKALRKQKEAAPLEALLAATLDDSIAVRREAATTLSEVGQSNPALVVAGVINLLRHSEAIGQYSEWEGEGYEVAWEAFVTLSAYTPAELLLQAIYDLEDIKARCAANALAQLGEDVPIEQLVYALSDKRPGIQQAAALALSRSGKRAPVADLIKALKTKDFSVRHEVIDALVEISKHGNVPDEIFLQKILKKRDYNTYTPLFQAFNAQGKPIPSKIVLEALEHFPHGMRPVVLEYLCLFPDLLATFPEKLIAQALALYAEEERYCTEPDEAGIISSLLPKLSVESLLETLTSQKSKKVRIGAWELLAKYPGVVPLEPIQEVMHDPDRRVRGAAIEYLQKRSEKLSAQSIIAHLDDPDNGVRVRTMQYLQTSPEKQTLQLLVACLQDVDEWVCKNAIRALASLGSQAPLPELIAMLEGPAPAVRAAAIQALAQPGLLERVPVELFINALGEYHDQERQVVLKVLCDKDPQSGIEQCIGALGDEDDNYALFAFQLLEQVHPAIIPDILQEAAALFQSGKPGRFFRTLNASFLADVFGNMDRATPDLMARLSELLDWPYWEVRESAARTLGKLRRNIPDATIRRLFDLRHDPHSRAVREAADGALAEILSLETGIEDD